MTIAGLLAALGIGAAGLIAMRSRRRHTEPEALVLAEPVAFAGEPARMEHAPLPLTPPVFAGPVCAGPVFAGPVFAAPEIPQRREEEVALPSTPVSADERSRIIEHMVEADPDEANPFTARPARRKRARLLLQKHEPDLRRGDAAFDWRTYRPPTGGNGTGAPANPELVTA